jgi:hypothetical protein
MCKTQGRSCGRGYRDTRRLRRKEAESSSHDETRMRYGGDSESIEGPRAKIQEVVEQAAGAACATIMSERGERRRARHNRAAASEGSCSLTIRDTAAPSLYVPPPCRRRTHEHAVLAPGALLPEYSAAPPASSLSSPSPPRPPRSRQPARPRRARACRHGPHARSRRLPPRVTRPRLNRFLPRPPPRQHPSRSRSPSTSQSSRTRRRRSSRRGTGTRPTCCTRCSRTPRSSRRFGARASPSSSPTVRRARLRMRGTRSSARRGSVGLCGFDVRGPAAFPKMQVYYWKNVLGDPAEHRRRGGVRRVRPAVRVSPSVRFPRADDLPTGLRQSSSARRSSTAPSPSACTLAV